MLVLQILDTYAILSVMAGLIMVGVRLSGKLDPDPWAGVAMFLLFGPTPVEIAVRLIINIWSQ